MRTDTSAFASEYLADCEAIQVRQHNTQNNGIRLVPSDLPTRLDAGERHRALNSLGTEPVEDQLHEVRLVITPKTVGSHALQQPWARQVRNDTGMTFR